MCKKMTNIFYWVKTKNLFGYFRIEEIRDIDNETGLKRRGRMEILTTVLPYTRCTALSSLEYLPSVTLS